MKPFEDLKFVSYRQICISDDVATENIVQTTPELIF
jgi:hypothetical protein